MPLHLTIAYLKVTRLRKVLKVLGVIVGVYVAAGFLAYALQRRVLFPAPALAVEPQMEGARLTRVTAPNGRTVVALHVPSPPGEATVVHFHGNGEQLADLVPLAWQFRRAKLGFFAVEYPGYGLSARYKPSEQALYADAEAALWHLHNGLEVPPAQVVLQGQSLGSGVAVEMARRGHGRRLVLISPFTSVVEMASRMLPIYPATWLVKDSFDNAEKAPEIELPVLIIHGTDDELVPHAMGKKLKSLFPNVESYWVQGAHHNDLFVRDGRLITHRVAGFVRGSTRLE